MAARLERFDTVEDLLVRAGPFLEAREAEHNLLLGICASLRAGAHDEPPYLAAAVQDGHVLYVAIKTPPYQLALSEVDDPSSLDVLLDDLVDILAPGVVGPKGVAVRLRRDSPHGRDAPRGCTCPSGSML